MEFYQIKERAAQLQVKANRLNATGCWSELHIGLADLASDANRFLEQVEGELLAQQENVAIDELQARVECNG